MEDEHMTRSRVLRRKTWSTNGLVARPYSTARKLSRTKLDLEELEGRCLLSTSTTGDAVLGQINHFIVIYQENWSFDSLYGFFPGANGIANATDASGNLLPQYQQVDKNGNVITTVPQPLGPNGAPDPRFPASLP